MASNVAIVWLLTLDSPLSTVPTLEPDGQATGCNAVEVGSTPTGVSWTAAMRSQANTAKLLESNPTLMRLRELEVLENVASSGNFNVVLGEKGLADRVVNLL